MIVVCGVLECNLNFCIITVFFTALAIHILKEDIQIAVSTTFNRENITCLTIPSDSSAAIVKNQRFGLYHSFTCLIRHGDSDTLGLNQIFHVGVVCKIDTNDIASIT